MIEELEAGYEEEGIDNSKYTHESYNIWKFVKLGLKFFLADLPTLIGWNVLAIFVGMADNKAMLAAFTIFVNIVEMSIILIFSLGY